MLLLSTDPEGRPCRLPMAVSAGSWLLLLSVGVTGQLPGAVLTSSERGEAEDMLASGLGEGALGSLAPDSSTDWPLVLGQSCHLPEPVVSSIKWEAKILICVY